MQQTIKATNISNGSTKEFTYIPEKNCPLCHVSFNGTVLSAFFLKHRTSSQLFVLHFCHGCNQVFFTVYTEDENTHPIYSRTTFIKHASFPYIPQTEEIPQVLKELSPRFAEVYSQAFRAEHYGLSEICGLGYRKAVEILIKDFSIYQHPENEETITSQDLSKCIRENIEHNETRELASRAAWLGNDHAHYAIKYEEFDLNVLKQIVSLCMKWIALQLESQKSIQKIQKKQRNVSKSAARTGKQGASIMAQEKLTEKGNNLAKRKNELRDLQN